MERKDCLYPKTGCPETTAWANLFHVPKESAEVLEMRARQTGTWTPPQSEDSLMEELREREGNQGKMRREMSSLYYKSQREGN